MRKIGGLSTRRRASAGDDPLSPFSPEVRRWFESSFEGPTPAQTGGWEAISSGANALICAPTGSGKTLAAFLWGIDKLARRAGEADQQPGVKLVYVSPLKALSYDIERNLRAPLRGIGAEISVGLRTGDTSQAERRAMRKSPPDILITTPESLYLILSSGAREILTSAEAVIVDEIHAVAQSKRGSHLALTIERLEHLVRDHAGDAAGPVAAGDPPPLPVAKASSGAVPPTAPPAATVASMATPSRSTARKRRPSLIGLAQLQLFARNQNLRINVGIEFLDLTQRHPGLAGDRGERVAVLDDIGSHRLAFAVAGLPRHLAGGSLAVRVVGVVAQRAADYRHQYDHGGYQGEDREEPGRGFGALVHRSVIV